eukprot:s339_g11.t1
MVLLVCCAELQLDVAKRTALAVRREEVGLQKLQRRIGIDVFPCPFFCVLQTAFAARVRNAGLEPPTCPGAPPPQSLRSEDWTGELFGQVSKLIYEDL